MFNESFFPTPPDVIDMMLEPFSEKDSLGKEYQYIKYNRILEPSAGKGNILDHLHSKYHVRKSNIKCIEAEYELQMILREKEYEVIDSDFLEYSNDYFFDFIIMNPPFNNGDEHLLKAWEILHSGDIACLLNADTIRNPYSKKRKALLSLINEYGKHKFIGNVFKDAERKTDVECVIVWLHKPEPEKTFNFNAEDFDFEGDVIEQDINTSPLASANIIEAMIAQYEAARKLIIEKNQLEKQIDFYTREARIATKITKKEADDPREISESQKNDDTNKKIMNLHEELDNLKDVFWKYIFVKTKIGKKAPSKFQKEFLKFQDEARKMAFNSRNIRNLLEMLLLNSGEIMRQAFCDVYDTATRYHKDNTEKNEEGWKTNKWWKINKKIIIPHGVTYSGQSYSGGVRFTVSWTREDFWKDLDKCMCQLDGKQLDEIVTVENAFKIKMDNLSDGTDKKYQAEFESTYFKIRFYKKGTVHLIFKNNDLLVRFNLVITEGKAELGDGS